MTITGGGIGTGWGRARETERIVSSHADFWYWWADRQRAGHHHVERIPLTDLDQWHFDQRSGNLAHGSGRFFTVEGLHLLDGTQVRHAQPVINQPEIGILGILVRELDGVLHCLMQAKMEPGNLNTFQLSPTVQATRSNYTRVHQGNAVPFLEYFTADRGRAVVDVLQSEQGAWFWRKRNRNMVVLVDHDVAPHEDYRWIPLPLVLDLLGQDNLVNMDSRTVLSCLPIDPVDEEPATPLRSSQEILSWFTDAKARCAWHPRLVPLREVSAWERGTEHIGAEDGDFRIIGVRIESSGREVVTWSQPLLEPLGPGSSVLVIRKIDGVRHVLMQAKAQPGLLDLVEMGPTVQQLPGERPSDLEPPLRAVAAGQYGSSLYDTVQSEEGGRFHHAMTRYRLVEVGDDFPVSVSAEYCWLTFGQASALLRHGHYLNVEARTLIACLRHLL